MFNAVRVFCVQPGCTYIITVIPDRILIRVKKVKFTENH